MVLRGGKQISINAEKLVVGVEQLTTPLLRQMAQFGRWLTVGIPVIVLITFFYGVALQDYRMTYTW
ncbi:MAG: hypothetical protein AB2536_04360 [Candidatus Thiodiazotropha endolucinida]